MIVLTAVAAAAVALAPAVDYTQDPEPQTYYLIPGGDGNEADPVAGCLLRLGWHGRADDGLAAIYAPTAVIRNCGGEPGYPTWL